MKNTTTYATYAFEPRQRSIAPVSVTFQGCGVPAAGAIAGWPTSASVPTPMSGHAAVIGRIGTDPQVFGTKPQALRSTAHRFHRTSPL